MGVVSVDSFLGTTTCLIGYYYAFLRQICHKLTRSKIGVRVQF